MNEINEKIATFEAAYREVIRNLIKRGHTIINTIPINQGRYLIIKTNKDKFLVGYKREVFFNFGKQFRDMGYSGVGDTFNVLDLEIAGGEGVTTIFSVFPNGAIYSIPLMQFISEGVQWVNKEGKSVISISIHKYKREFEK